MERRDQRNVSERKEGVTLETTFSRQAITERMETLKEKKVMRAAFRQELKQEQDSKSKGKGESLQFIPQTRH